MPRIKINQDKTENYRGNHTQYAFRFNNSPYTFEFSSISTYKGFLSKVRNLARKYGAAQVDIVPLSAMDNNIIVKRYTNDSCEDVIKYYTITKTMDESNKPVYVQKDYTEKEIFPNE